MAGTKPSTGETNVWAIVQAVCELFEGRSHAVGTFTLATGAATTVVTAPNCAPSAYPLLTPLHANAAAEIASGNMYVSAIAKGQFTVTHTNSATANRKFGYALQG